MVVQVTERCPAGNHEPELVRLSSVVDIRLPDCSRLSSRVNKRRSESKDVNVNITASSSSSKQYKMGLLRVDATTRETL